MSDHDMVEHDVFEFQGVGHDAAAVAAAVAADNSSNITSLGDNSNVTSLDSNVTSLDSNSTSTGDAVVVGWSPIYVTLLISLAQGIALFAFFLYARRSESKGQTYDVYERRVFTRSHRSPPPFDDGGGGMLGWATAAFRTKDDDLLRCVGLDSYMYLRFLRLGFRCSAFGAFLGCVILIPLYYTGGAEGPETEAFNSITLANVLPGSARLWASVVCWILFVGFTLREMWNEWEHYAERRSNFLAKGDADTDPDYRYAILVENVPKEYRGNERLKGYFDRLFPGKVRQANVCLDTSKIDAMVAEREKLILQHEKADAFTHAKPEKPKPQVRVDGITPFCGGKKVEVLPHTARQIKRLNRKIDGERRALWMQADAWSADPLKASAAAAGNGIAFKAPVLGKIKIPVGKNGRQGPAGAPQDNEDGGEKEARAPESNLKDSTLPPPSSRVRHSTMKGGETSFHDEVTGVVNNSSGPVNSNSNAASSKPVNSGPISGSGKASRAGSLGESAASTAEMSSTAFVTFTSLRAKQCAVQCELSGKIDRMEAVVAPEPTGVLWSNVPVPINTQKYAQMLAAIFWTVGVLFWAVPVSFVTGIANLNGILGAAGLPLMDESSFLYGLIAGLLPVIFLKILMIVLYLSIGMSASKAIRKKSVPEVDQYTFYWHQLYQFANLWLIVLGGSLFNQMDALLNDPTSVATLLASAMPGAATFFVNMISVASFGAFGMELSQVVPYVIRAVMNKLVPVAGRTQRALDEGTKPESIEWGKQLPPIVFIFLVGLVYMPIVPIVELFAAAYFGGSYLVWTHQCLHVYAQEFEGGGKPVWENLSSFMFVSLYTAEAIFFAYMSLKQGAAQATVAVICLVLTLIVHGRLRRNVMRPLANLALEVAARADVDEGELDIAESSVRPQRYSDAVERQLYGQPNLKRSKDERRPMPYRRKVGGDENVEEKV